MSIQPEKVYCLPRQKCNMIWTYHATIKCVSNLTKKKTSHLFHAETKHRVEIMVVYDHKTQTALILYIFLKWDSRMLQQRTLKFLFIFSSNHLHAIIYKQSSDLCILYEVLVLSLDQCSFLLQTEVHVREITLLCKLYEIDEHACIDLKQNRKSFTLLAHKSHCNYSGAISR